MLEFVRPPSTALTGRPKDVWLTDRGGELGTSMLWLRWEGTVGVDGESERLRSGVALSKETDGISKVLLPSVASSHDAS